MQIPILNFSGGEVSPDMYGKPDNQLYAASGIRMENFIPRLQGPMQGRSGTGFAHPTAHNNAGRLERFKYSDTQVFILEFTDGILRIYEDAALTLNASSKAISGITAANPGVITATSHGFSDGDEVYLAGIVGMTQLNGRFVRVANKTTHTFEIVDLFDNNINTTSFTAYSSGGTATKVFEVASPYSGAQIDAFDYAQAGNVAYTHHRDVAPYKLTRVSASNWTFATYSRTNDPFPSAGNYPGTCTFFEGRFVSASTINNPDGFYASMSPDTATGASKYDDYTNSASDADEAIQIPLSGPAGDVETVNWIRAGRKAIVAGTPNGIIGIDGGAQGDAITPANIRVRGIDSYGAQAVWPIAAASVIYYVQKGGKFLRSLEYDFLSDADKSFDRSFVSSHMVGAGTFTKIALQKGSPDIIWAITSLGALLGYALKPKEDVSGWHRYPLGGARKVISIATEPQTDNVDRVWFMVERQINSATVRYNEFLTEPFQGLEVSEYYTGKENKEADLEAYINETFEAQRTIKYLDSHLVFDGSDRGSITITPAAIEGDGVVFTASGALFTSADVGKEIHKKYADRAGGGRAVIREYTNSTHVECEILIPFDSTDAIAAGSWYLTTDRITGLHHFEGKTVKVLADGRSHPTVLVTGGVATLDFQAGYVVVGESYRQFWKSLPIAMVFANGNILSRVKNVSAYDLLVHNTMGLKYGTDPYDLQEIPPSHIGQLPDRPPVPFTGVLPNQNAVEWDERLCLYIVQEQPYPTFINAISIEMMVGE